MTRTYDSELIRGILTDPAIYPFISDDSSPSADTFQPNMDERIIYLYEPPGFLALFVFDSAASCVAHINIAPEMRGKSGIEAGRRAIHWIWRNSQYLRIWGAISADNIRAIRYARLCGMKVFGRNEKSFMKNGKLTDQVLLGVSKWQRQ